MKNNKSTIHSEGLEYNSNPYRPDIDGLRAIAIIFVVIYHLFPDKAPNGFLGVDIFFVISGYLIWQNSFSRVKKGKYSAFDFFRKRIIRLAPALIFAFSLLLAAGHQNLMSHEFSTLGKQIFSGSLFISNINFWADSGYFDSSAHEKPLLNLWSLGVEGQFYLLFPIIIFFATKAKNNLLCIFAGTIFLLGAFALTAKSSNTAAFFLIQGRLWQFMLGILIGILEEKILSTNQETHQEARRKVGNQWKYAAYSTLIILFFIAFFSEQNTTQLNIHVVAVTALSGALILFSGKTNGVNILSNDLMVFLGRISYPLYLWHWPILYFLQHAGHDLSIFEINTATIIISVFLSILTYRYVELPIQRWGKKNAKLAAASLVATLGFCAIIGQLVNLKYIRTQSFENESTLSEALNDWAAPSGGMRENDLIVNSIKGHSESATLFLGDSHIEQYWPRIEYLVNSNPDRSRSALFVAWGGCPPFPDTKELGTTRPCQTFVRKAFDMANTSPEIKAVVLAAYWEWYFFGAYDRPETWKSTLQQTNSSNSDPILFGQTEAENAFQKLEMEIRRLIQNGKTVALVLSNPAGKLNNPRQMLQDLKRKGEISSEDYGVDRNSFSNFSRPVIKKLRDIANRTGAQIIDPVEFMCPDNRCVALHQGKPIYRDDDHIRPFYVKYNVFFLDSLILENK